MFMIQLTWKCKSRQINLVQKDGRILRIKEFFKDDLK